MKKRNEEKNMHKLLIRFTSGVPCFLLKTNDRQVVKDFIVHVCTQIEGGREREDNRF